MNERDVWQITVVLRANDVEAEEAAEAIARALCPDEFHDGPCKTPWTLIKSRLDDADDPDEAANLRELVDDE